VIIGYRSQASVRCEQSRRFSETTLQARRRNGCFPPSDVTIDGRSLVTSVPAAAIEAYLTNAPLSSWYGRMIKSDHRSIIVRRGNLPYDFRRPHIVFGNQSMFDIAEVEGHILAARLTDDDVQPVGNRKVTFTVDSDAGQSQCSGDTDADCIARCKISGSRSPGRRTLLVAFGGDAYYEAATARQEVDLNPGTLIAETGRGACIGRPQMIEQQARTHG
jgi:hypothetical protein